MAQTLESLTRHHGTLASIRGIVHAMKTLSALNASPYEDAACSIEAYHQTIMAGFRAFAHRSGDIVLAPDRRAGQLVVVFGSDHGLCGNYNELLADAVMAWCKAPEADSCRVLCVGAQMNDALVDRGLPPEEVLLPPASADGIGRLAGDVVTRLDSHSSGRWLGGHRVSLAFTERGDAGALTPVTRQLLPLDPDLLRRERRWPSRSLPDYTMAPDELLAALVRNHIFASVFRASAEAMVTENAARLARMQQAEEAVDDRLDALKGELRSVRQTEITSELLDVIIGFEALKKRARR
ncbi:ATPase [Marinobacter halodurans]|uniref:ATPase n=1 Tax=Marinobacter halodurans TaxID=2528979 RepID=A0ABY1ZJU9_9GAMM|nr:FoF1 ATP synthase subunit gamma [Marinobacter halodurans]TBW55491.1 ATPase [Marinobacter halodurans]